jgi:putative ubiquitin-RnfH superfamily antitoxin RatB of RatAB toxin-antitoxin module
MASADAVIAVEVAWSPAPREMRRAALRLPAGSTIAAALQATGWAELAPAWADDAALAAAGLSVAVWSHGRALGTELRDGDRVEVLRALTIAPMDARRARYEAAGGVKALRRRKYEAQIKR